MLLFVGINWDIKLLDDFDRMNQKHSPDIIDEVYGSMKNDPLGQVRESKRLSNVGYKEIEEFVENAHSKNIGVCYAINSPIITPKHIAAKSEDISYFIRQLERMGIDGIIVASPAFAKYFLVAHSKSMMHVIGSTVLGLNTLEQIDEFEETFDRVCPHTDKNRDIVFLKKMNRIIEVELLVNEMCLHHCAWRNYHYCQEASSQMFESSKILKGFESYPIDECWKCFVDRPSNILKSRWVRPEDIHLYESVGIEWFKLSGRTMPTEWIIRVAKAYVERTYDGNLLDLFPIVTGSLSKEKEGNKIFYINNNAIDGLGAELLRRDNGNCSLGCKIISCDICDREWESYKESGIVREMKI